MAIADHRQLSLDLALPPLASRAGPTAAGRRGDAVFFAAMPPGHVADGLGRAGRCDAAWRPARVLHVSLAAVGRWEDLPDDRLARARRAREALAAECFPARFNRVVVFGRASRPPLVLCCDEASIASFTGIARSLRRLLVEAGFDAPPRPGFAPHLTIGYARAPARARIEPPDPPIAWPVRDVVLVRSRFGQARYDQSAAGRLPIHRPRRRRARTVNRRIGAPGDLRRDRHPLWHHHLRHGPQGARLAGRPRHRPPFP